VHVGLDSVGAVVDEDQGERDPPVWPLVAIAVHNVPEEERKMMKKKERRKRKRRREYLG